jgi:hypothetical protein
MHTIHYHAYSKMVRSLEILGGTSRYTKVPANHKII